ncbi:MAG: sulfite exporter TauE/SafE family protein [Burkholderiaceae bacterium]|nr:sulfite exporter TauE/SafE family protein [Burkholderiaceae bacterium]
MSSVSVWWLAYPLLGAIVSLIAGMFGVGGGLVLVPILYMLFAAQGFPHEHIMHIALGTTMMSMIVTVAVSMNVHRKLGNIDWTIAKIMAIGLALGSVAGSTIASRLPTRPLTLIFSGIVILAAINMILNIKPSPSRQLPGTRWQLIVSFVFGIIAALTAATGGFLVTPYLAWHNVPMKRAIGTTSAIGVPVAIGGAFSDFVAGWSTQNLPPLTYGFVCLPALIGIVCCSSVFASWGARLVSRMDGDKVKRIFGAYVLIIALKMLHSALTA